MVDKTKIMLIQLQTEVGVEVLAELNLTYGLVIGFDKLINLINPQLGAEIALLSN